MKKYTPYLITLMVGVVAGMLMHRSYHFREVTNMVQRDTVVRYDTVRYSRLELAAKSRKLEIPKAASAEFVFIPEESVSVIYRDSVRYVTLPREYFFTETDDVQIWHSGIDSKIDSLNVFSKTTNITETIPDKKHWDKHRLTFYGSAGYSNLPMIPVGVKYTYYPKKWFGVGVKGEKELISNLNAVFLTAEIGISW